MIVPINNNFSPLPFYEVSGLELDNKYLLSNRPYSYGAVYDLPISEGWLMPFQFDVDFESTEVVAAYVIPLDANTGIPINGVMVTPSSDGSYSKVMFYGAQIQNLPIGRMYIELELSDDNEGRNRVVMSDIFNNIFSANNNLKQVPEGYVRLTYGNDHELKRTGGEITFGKFSFEVLVKSTIGKPQYAYEEKASERLGYRYIESQVSKKSYQMCFMAPEYLCDALRLMPMCNVRSIVDELYPYNNISDVELEVSWQEQGDLAAVTLTFNTDTVVSNLAEYKSTAPERLNTVLPPIPTPEVGLPIVNINSIVELLQDSAVINSEVVSDGGGVLSERGICWSSSSSTPTINDAHVSASTAELGQYQLAMQNLQPNTAYYVRAYATNNIGTAYSGSIRVVTQSEPVLPTVVTDRIDYSPIGISPLIGGEVVDEGSSPVTQRGILISSTNQSPTVGGTGVTLILDTGIGAGYYACRAHDLEYATTYYYRAFAISEVGTGYGQIRQFTTEASAVELATVVTSQVVSNISPSGATLGGEVTDDGGGNVTERGVVVSATDIPTINDLKFAASQAGLGQFTVNATGLTADTSYTFRAYAINEAGVSYGDAEKFRTGAAVYPPDVEFDQWMAQYNSIRLDAHVEADNGSQVTEMGFCYSTSNNTPTIADSHIVAGQVSGYSFGDSIPAQPNTTYYCRAYAINSAGVGYSEVITVVTPSAPVNVPTVTSEQTSIDFSSRVTVFNGNVTDSGGAAVTQRGFCISLTNPTPTISDTNVPAATGGVGQFSVRVGNDNFKEGATYYYRAYAINSAGVGYSDVKTVTAPVQVVLPTVLTYDATDVSYQTANISGSVTNEGSSSVTSRGLLLSSTNQTPTLNGAGVEIFVRGSGLGSFMAELRGLAANTTYYYRAYGTSGVGTGYGVVKTFTTRGYM